MECSHDLRARKMCSSREEEEEIQRRYPWSQGDEVEELQ